MAFSDYSPSESGNIYIFSDSVSADQSILAQIADINDPAYQLEPEKDFKNYLFKEGLIEEGETKNISCQCTM